MDIDRVTYLHEQFLLGKLTVAESLEWQRVLDDPDEEELLLSIADGFWQHTPEELLEDMPQAVSSQILSQVVGHAKSGGHIRKLWTRWVAAGAIVVTVMVGGHYANRIADPKPEFVKINDIAPGKNGATLTLSDGRKILINDALAGKVAEEAGVRISKNADGQLVYEVTGVQSKNLTYNTLTTTRGEQAQVRLPDGTLVFLNAESALRYPSSFAGVDKREVELKGEGYFEVRKDKVHPFIVKSREQTVEVLGTQFNIKAYEDEAIINTTLVEGSVKVGDVGLKVSGVLKPGQQSRLKNGVMDVVAVEVENVVAWKEGFFIFDSKPLEAIMQDVSRWYNVKVVFKDEVLRHKTFLGSISRFNKVSKVLELLEGTSDVRFEVKGQRLIVSGK
mgnify:CR=1 FL=1